jgi:hypothetical protein
MKIFKELKKLGYIHYSATTIEELDDLPLNSAERISEQALVLRWFREKYNLVIQYIPYEIDDSEGQSILHHRHKISEYDSWRGGRRNTVETELTEDYEEAELECLVKLIKIVKNGK